MTFSGATAVGFDVEEIVDEVGSRGGAAEAEESEKRLSQDGEGAIVGEQGRKKDEEVLCPLVRPERFEQRTKRIGTFFEHVRRCDSVPADTAAQCRAGVCQHFLRGAGEEGKICSAVSDVGKAVPTELVLEQRELFMSSEICDAVA